MTQYTLKVRYFEKVRDLRDGKEQYHWRVVVHKPHDMDHSPGSMNDITAVGLTGKKLNFRCHGRKEYMVPFSDKKNGDFRITFAAGDGYISDFTEQQQENPEIDFSIPYVLYFR